MDVSNVARAEKFRRKCIHGEGASTAIWFVVVLVTGASGWCKSLKDCSLWKLTSSFCEGIDAQRLGTATDSRSRSLEESVAQWVQL